MKLAEALQERRDLNTRIMQLESRIANSALVQEGERPAEDVEDLIAEVGTCTDRLQDLISRINLTNAKTLVDSVPLAALLARRDVLGLKINVYRSFVSEASQIARRVSGSEIKLTSTIDVKKYQKILDAFSKELRLLDNSIQSSNWTVDLL